MSAGQYLFCEACGDSERYANGLCAICSTEKEQVARDRYIDFIAGRNFQTAHNGVYIHKESKANYAEAMDMVAAGILYIAPTSTANLTIFRVTDEYMAILDKRDKEKANAAK